MKTIIIVGKHKQAVLELHNRFTNDKKGISSLMLGRILSIVKTPLGAKLTIKNRAVARYISTEDILDRIAKQIDTLEKGVDYELEVEK